jgi:predicted phosphodiesterase
MRCLASRARIVLVAALVVLCGAGMALAGSLRVAVLADLNGDYGSTSYTRELRQAVARIVEMKPDLVICAGDMVAGQRQPLLSDDKVRAMWRAFHAVVSEPLAAAGIPLAVTPGNHDASASGKFAAERRIFAEEWRARRPQLNFVDGGDYPFFYAFDMGGIRFAAIDATRAGPLSGNQAARLKGLFSGRAGETNIVFGHLPIWSVSRGREGDVVSGGGLVRALQAGGVDLYLTGHDHAFYPARAEGILQIVLPSLGTEPRALEGTSPRTPLGFVWLELGAGGEVSYQSLAAPAFTGPLRQTMPDRIGALVLDRTGR